MYSSLKAIPNKDFNLFKVVVRVKAYFYLSYFLKTIRRNESMMQISNVEVCNITKEQLKEMKKHEIIKTIWLESDNCGGYVGTILEVR